MKVVGAKVNEETRKRWEEEAKKRGWTMSQFIKEMVERGLQYEELQKEVAKLKAVVNQLSTKVDQLEEGQKMYVELCEDKSAWILEELKKEIDKIKKNQEEVTSALNWIKSYLVDRLTQETFERMLRHALTCKDKGCPTMRVFVKVLKDHGLTLVKEKDMAILADQLKDLEKELKEIKERMSQR